MQSICTRHACRKVRTIKANRRLQHREETPLQLALQNKSGPSHNPSSLDMRITSCVSRFLIEKYTTATKDSETHPVACGRGTSTWGRNKPRKQQQRSAEERLPRKSAAVATKSLLTNIGIYRAAKRLQLLKSWCLRTRGDFFCSSDGYPSVINSSASAYSSFSLPKDSSAAERRSRQGSGRYLRTSYGGMNRRATSSTFSVEQRSQRKRSSRDVDSAEGLAIVPLTSKYKLSIVKNMIKTDRVPKKVLEEELSKVGRSVQPGERLTRVAELILKDYDVIVQDSTPPPDSRPPDLAMSRKTIDSSTVNVSVETTATLAARRTGPSPNIMQRLSPNAGVRIRRNVLPPSRARSCVNNKAEKTKPLILCEKEQAATKTIESPVDSPLKSNISINEPKVYPYTYQTHPINKIIGQINAFLALMNKIRTTASSSSADVKAVNDLCRRLRLSKTRMTPESLKTKEGLNEAKEKLLRLLFNTINKENEMTSVLSASKASAKYYVANGNNGQLVRTVMKERWWWSPAAEISGANVVWTPWKRQRFVAALPLAGDKSAQASPIQLCNHLEGNCNLGDKKSLYMNLLRYCEATKKDVCDIVPLTFHVRNEEDLSRFREAFATYRNQLDYVKSKLREDEGDAAQEEYKRFLKYNRNMWIVKPGENSNRGTGILVSKDLKEIEEFVADTSAHTYIVQKYIERPFLIHQRKFDIRCFALLTSINGLIKGYFYQEGYLRTSSKKYSLDSTARAVHLTNEAVQIRYDDFGKYEAGNKVF